MEKIHLKNTGKLIFSAALLGLSLTACKVTIEDGKIPTEHIPAAREYAGTYRGQMDGRNGSINLVVANDGKTTIHSNIDLVGAGCRSELGQILSVNVSRNATLKSAEFALNPGLCRVVGRKVILNFKRNNAIEVYIAESTHIEMDTFPTCSGGGAACDRNGNCRPLPDQCDRRATVVTNYLRGTFLR